MTIDLNVSSHNWVQVGPNGLYVCSVCSYRKRRALNGVGWDFWKNLKGTIITIAVDKECVNYMEEVTRAVLDE